MKTRNAKKITVTLMLAVLGFAGAASAAPRFGRPAPARVLTMHEVMRRYDDNHNGRLDRWEERNLRRDELAGRVVVKKNYRFGRG